jgi:hypothetical protein
VPVERDDHGLGFVLPGIRQRLSDDLLMPQMHTIEHTDGRADFAAASVQFPGRVNDVHAGAV